MSEPRRVQRGEFCEDCRCHPMLCRRSSSGANDELIGVSLINGRTGSRSEDHCGIVPMTVDEAIEHNVNRNAFAERRHTDVDVANERAAPPAAPTLRRLGT